MNADRHKLLQEALELPEPQRAELAARLIDSLDEGFDEDATAAWDEEIARRVAELDRGEAKPIPWPELRRRLMGRLNDASAA